MRKLLIFAALSATMFLFDTESAFAGRRGAKGGGSSCSGGCGSCSGGCGTCYGGGCASCYGGSGSYCASCSAGGCPGGVCSVGGGGGVVVASNTSVAASATLTVALPADATLTIDNTTPTTSTGAVRTYRSPALETGKEFEYTLTAQVVRDGKPVAVTKTVTVRAGEETRVQMDLPVQVASAQ